MKRLLLITQAFYPDSAVGSHRAGKICKFLGEFGWQTTVLAAQHQYAERGLDPGLWAKIPPGVRIIRTPAPALRHASAWLKRQVGLAAPPPWALTDTDRSTAQTATGPTSRLKRLALALIVPGPWVLWLPFALRPAIAAARQCHAVMSTSPYASAHLLAQRAHRPGGIPWVADFRDPWVLREPREDDCLDRWHMRKINGWLERRVVREASALTFANEALKQRYLEHYGRELESSKCHCVMNGFDPDDFPRTTNPSPRLSGQACHLCYFGTLYVGRDPTGLFQALRQLRQEPATARLKFHVHLFGLPQPAVDQAARQIGVPELITQHGMIPHAEALAIMQQCHVLLLIGSEQTDAFSIAGKFFEYVYAGPPILALVPEGPIGQMVRQYQLGPAVGIEDVAGIRRALLELHERTVVQRDWSVPAATRAVFHRRQQVRRLAEVLDEAVAGGRASWGRY